MHESHHRRRRRRSNSTVQYSTAQHSNHLQLHRSTTSSSTSNTIEARFDDDDYRPGISVPTTSSESDDWKFVRERPSSQEERTNQLRLEKVGAHSFLPLRSVKEINNEPLLKQGETGKPKFLFTH
jgi:hypothetical protein